MLGEFFGGSLRQVRGKSDIHPGGCEGADFVELGSRSVLALSLARFGGFFLLGFFGALFLGRFCGRLRGLCRCCLLRLRLELFLFGAQGLDECPGSFGVELFAVLFPGRGGFLLGGSLPLGFLGVGFLFRVVVGGGGLRHHAPPSLVRMFFGIAKGGAHLMVWRPPVWVG